MATEPVEHVVGGDVHDVGADRAQIATVRDGKMTYVEIYDDGGEALKAAGLPDAARPSAKD